MSNWKEFVKKSCAKDGSIDLIDKGLKEKYSIYESSVNSTDEVSCFMAIHDKKKVLIVTGGSKYAEFEGEEEGIDELKVKVCLLSIKNSKVIQSIFPFTNPSSA